MTADGTMTLCAVCRRVITCWSDVPIDGLPGGIMVVWLHFVPDPNHPAVPLAPFFDRDRVLLCSSCHQPQVRDVQGWHCESCDHT